MKYELKFAWSSGKQKQYIIFFLWDMWVNYKRSLIYPSGSPRLAPTTLLDPLFEFLKGNVKITELDKHPVDHFVLHQELINLLIVSGFLIISGAPK